MTKVKVSGMAATELDIQHEVLESGDLNGRLVSQWTGTHVIVYDREHAAALYSIANEWSNDIDRDIHAGVYSDPESKRHARAVSIGLGTLAVRLAKIAWQA